MYVLVNRFFVEEELEALREHLQRLKDLDVDGIYYGDEGVYQEAKALGIENRLIYNPDTLITNHSDVQYYLDEGISMVTISKEITLDEICAIAKKVQGECEVIIHGRLNMMHSKRNLLSNYFSFLGNKKILEIRWICILWKSIEMSICQLWKMKQEHMYLLDLRYPVLMKSKIWCMQEFVIFALMVFSMMQIMLLKL